VVRKELTKKQQKYEAKPDLGKKSRNQFSHTEKSKSFHIFHHYQLDYQTDYIKEWVKIAVMVDYS